VADDRCDLLCLDLPRAETIRTALNLGAATAAASRSRALGDATPMTVALALREGGELCVCDLGRAKQRIGSKLGSGVTAGEGAQNLLCAYLAAGVLAGLIVNEAFGWWWADPLIALGVAGLAVKEGSETWRGEGCCAPSALAGSSALHGDCCAP
jgi:divalent metal cation (Fe/Co/Zn/Cd) transporter